MRSLTLSPATPPFFLALEKVCILGLVIILKGLKKKLGGSDYTSKRRNGIRKKMIEE